MSTFIHTLVLGGLKVKDIERPVKPTTWSATVTVPIEELEERPLNPTIWSGNSGIVPNVEFIAIPVIGTATDPVPKIVPKSYDIKKLFEYNDFQEGRIRNFDAIEDKINSILPMVSNAKNRTAEFYNENPGSYSINYPTDAILKELDDIIEQLNQANEDISKSV